MSIYNGIEIILDPELDKDKFLFKKVEKTIKTTNKKITYLYVSERLYNELKHKYNEHLTNI